MFFKTIAFCFFYLAVASCIGFNATFQLADKPQGATAELKLPSETNF